MEYILFYFIALLLNLCFYNWYYLLPLPIRVTEILDGSIFKLALYSDCSLDAVIESASHR